MSQFSDDAARQVEAEQDHVSAMYDLLGVRVGDARRELTVARRARAAAAPAPRR
ncbi:hypothetical protein [Streptomyces chartreusis]|uniref:hypothetical protein n=1 Tax=Streptomyces chartreusis TaxID=1969 RepID=UPI00363ED942